MDIEQLSLTELKEVKEIVDSLIAYSQASIISSNFVEAFYKYSVEQEDGSFRLHGNIKLFGAKSLTKVDF